MAGIAACRRSLFWKCCSYDLLHRKNNENTCLLSRFIGKMIAFLFYLLEFLNGVISIFIGLLMKRDWCVESGFKGSLLSFVVFWHSNSDGFFFFVRFIVTKDINIIKIKQRERTTCWDKRRYVCFDRPNAFLQFFFLFATMREWKRKVVSAAVAQDFVHLCHQRYERIVKGTGRDSVICLPNRLNKSLNILCNNFFQRQSRAQN